MAWWGRVAGGTLGMIGFGPIGAVLGYVIGSRMDKAMKSGREQLEYGSDDFDDVRDSVEAVQTAFFVATFSVLGYIAKADGRVSAQEIRHAEYVMSQMSLAHDQRKVAVQLFNEGKKSNFDVDAVLNEFMWYCKSKKNLKRMFMTILIESAFADGDVDPAETDALMHVSETLRFSAREFREMFESIRSSHAEFRSGGTSGAPPRAQLGDDFKVLGISEQADDAEIKRAYRRKISQFHPDKLVSKGLPDEMIEMATEKSKQIRAAYERIRDSRKEAGTAR